MNKLWKTLWVFALMFFFVACGGGGGPSPAPTPPSTTPDTAPPVISLVGPATVTVEAGAPYVDQGATAFDNVDGNITARIITNCNVNTAVVGVYLCTYNVSDSSGNPAVQVTRTVNVVDTTGPGITVPGSNPDSVLVGSVYTPPTATAIDTIDGVRPVSMSGTVNTAVVGGYTLTYTSTDSRGNTSSVNLVVNVIPVPDTTPPVITLVGVDPQTVYVGESYIDLGATALDNVDGNITARIITNCNVNTAVVGAYSCTYNVSDSSGNPAVQVTRTVNVVAAPVLATGLLYYPGIAPNTDHMVSKQDLATGAVANLWGGTQCNAAGCALMYPGTIVPVRNGGMVAFAGSNTDGINVLNTTTFVATQQTTGSRLFDGECSGWPEGAYDINATGTMAVFSNRCFPGGWGSGLPEYRAIIMMKLDGTMSIGVHVTTSKTDMVTSPVFGETDPATGNISVYFVVSNTLGTNIYKQMVNPVTGLTVGPQVLVASNVAAGFRAITIDATFTQMAFTRNVGGTTHVFVKPLAGGAEVDLVAGVDPYWATDGSNRIMYSVPCSTLACLAAGNPGARWAVLPDGTGKVKVPTPANFTGTTIGDIVLGR